MKKILASISIVILIIFTAFTKSSTKKLDKEIFDAKEELRFLNEKYELVLLDHNPSLAKKLHILHNWVDIENVKLKKSVDFRKTWGISNPYIADIQNKLFEFISKTGFIQPNISGKSVGYKLLLKNILRLQFLEIIIISPYKNLHI